MRSFHFSFSGTLTIEQANQLTLRPLALVDQTATAATVTTSNLGVTSLIVTGVVSVISSLAVFSVLLLGLRAREKRQTAQKHYEADQDEIVMPTPKWSGTNAGTVRSLSSISRINPAFDDDDDNYSLTSTNTDLSSTNRH